ncbi:MAG TPA: ATP-binding protein [Blastococcus sp.]|nr:ATP-binding protein [Blastococcus sp.]
MADPVELVGGNANGTAAVLRFPVRVRQTRTWRLPATPLSVREMRRELRPFLAASGLPDDDLDDLVLAACEAAGNGIEHARAPTRPCIDVLAEIDGRRVRIVVRDHGRWDPERHDAGNRGRGLHMMQKLAAVSLTSGPLGTSVTLRSRGDGRRDP